MLPQKCTDKLHDVDLAGTLMMLVSQEHYMPDNAATLVEHESVSSIAEYLAMG